MGRGSGEPITRSLAEIMIAADESDYVCSCNCDSLRGHVLKYIFNLHDLVTFLVLFVFHLWVDTHERQGH